MSVAKFERFFRETGTLDIDKEDLKRYNDFINEKIYDLLIAAQATAKMNIRDVIQPQNVPITKGLQEHPRLQRAPADGRASRRRCGVQRTSGEALERPLARLAHLFFAIARRRIRLQRMDQPMRGCGHLVDGAAERSFVDARRPCRAAQLSDELERRRANLVVGRRRLKVGERLDVATHPRSPRSIASGDGGHRDAHFHLWACRPEPPKEG
jgi:uncharacterized protein DUF1931